MLYIERRTLRGHSQVLCQQTDQLQHNTDPNSSKKSNVCPSVHGIKRRIGNTSFQLSMHVSEVRYNFCRYHTQKQLCHLVLHNFLNVWVTATMQPSFCFGWILNSKRKNSLTLYSFSIRFLWRLTALAANVDEELWKHKKENKISYWVAMKPLYFHDLFTLSITLRWRSKAVFCLFVYYENPYFILKETLFPSENWHFSSVLEP